MDAFEEIEDEIRRQEDRVKARELRKRLAELEKDLVETPKAKNSSQPSEAEAREVDVMKPATKAGRLSKKMANLGKFCLIVVSVIVAIRLAAWIGTIVMVLGVTWIAYKLFLESND